MAIYYGGTSKYLKWLGWKFFLWLLLAIVLIVLISYYISRISELHYGIVMLPLFLLVGLLLFVADKHALGQKKLGKGRIGEWEIGKLLSKLPDSYYIFQDVVLGKGNIDFVVVGPSGVYAIEVKSHSGKIDFDGYKLTQNGRPFDRNFLGQAKYEAMDLKRFLEANLNRQVFVKAVLVFSGRAYMSFGFNPIDNVFVVNKDSLLRLIDYKPILNQELINNITSLLIRTHSRE